MRSKEERAALHRNKIRPSITTNRNNRETIEFSRGKITQKTNVRGKDFYIDLKLRRDD
tara:strand:+ start:574 stop:747 length:174 start_codon:yes stop_codon:yes gene_type:complete